MEIKYRIDLYQLLPENPVVCEVGVAEGYFSQHMARDWKASMVYCVDNWGTISNWNGDGAFPQEWHNMNYHAAIWKMYRFRERTTFLRGISWEMSQHVADESLDLLYLDANHSEEGVLKDLHAWFPKVKKGGIIAGHDFENQDYGVKSAVYKFTHKIGVDVHRITEDKWEDAGFWFRTKLKTK